MNHLNPMAQEALASVVRSILKLGAGYLVARGVWAPDDASNYVAAGALAIVGLGWSYWTTYQSRRKLVTALASPTMLTEAQVQTRVAHGMAPSIATPKDEVPR